MARPKKCRRICCEPSYDSFSPEGMPSGEPVCLTVDEYETIRLLDYEKLTQEQCAFQMEVARTTVTEMYESARHKIADCLVSGKPLSIGGGRYRVCDGGGGLCMGICGRGLSAFTTIQTEKGANQMRVAVTYENGMIFQHFGHTEQFKVYDIENGQIVHEEVVGTNGQGHGALAGFLLSGKVDTLICGGIGGGAQAALGNAGIKLYGGVQGSADDAVKALIAGNLGYDPDVHCDHHDHEGGEHTCGSHGCHS